jgi:hypothetical protein
MALKRAFKKAIDLWSGIYVHNGMGNFFTVASAQTDPRSGEKTLSDRQLKRIIAKALLENRWNELYFYRGNKIDVKLMQRAQSIYNLQMPSLRARMATEGRAINFSTSLMDKPEPWAGVLRRAFGHALDVGAQNRAIARSTRQAKRAEFWATLGM